MQYAAGGYGLHHTIAVEQNYAEILRVIPLEHTCARGTPCKKHVSAVVVTGRIGRPAAKVGPIGRQKTSLFFQLPSGTARGILTLFQHAGSKLE